MKTVIIDMRIFTLFIIALVGFQALGRTEIPLNQGWKFTDEQGLTVTVDLPHDFLISQPWVEPDADDKGDANNEAANVKSRLSPRAFKEMGTGTYELIFTPDKNLMGHRLLLDFGGIMLVGDVYLNEEYIGGTDYGYLGFEIDVTDKLKIGEENKIKVVASTGEAENSRWYTGGGLYRGVKLIATDPNLYFQRHPLKITTKTQENEARIEILADIRVKDKLEFLIAKVEISDHQGQKVIQRIDTLPVIPKWRNREYELSEICILNPILWDTNTPHLYTATITLLNSEGQTVDEAKSRFGIRTFEFSPEFGLKLNGKKVLLQGIANHHTLGALGAANYPRAIEKRLQMLKDFGFNHVRCSHNPYSEEFLDLCDQYGFIVVDELYDKWTQQYTGGRKPWEDQWQYDLPEWVKRDRNHPCVAIWSIGNELQGFTNLPHNDWGVTAYRMMKPVLRRYDAERPITVAMHPRVRSLATDSVPAPLVFETDIAAYNYRYMYFPGDHRRWPNMIFYQSEANLANMGPNFFEPANERVLGLAYWGMIDYLGESLGWPAKGWSNGVFDISLQPKSQAWFLRSMFKPDEPIVHIGVITPKDRIQWNGVDMGGEMAVDSWNFQLGDTLQLYTYTNAVEVALLINGNEVGRKRNEIENSKHRNKIAWDNVAYEPGKIVAIGYDSDGNELCRHQLITAGEPVRLILEPDNDAWEADGLDLQHVVVRAVDKGGNTVSFANNKIDFALSGPARIVGIDNGDISSDELHSPASDISASRNLYQGTALIILRSENCPGEVTLTATAPALDSTTISLTSRK